MSESNKGKHSGPLNEKQKEAAKKRGEARRGKAPWNKGIPCRPETKEKLRLNHLGQVPPNKGKRVGLRQKRKRNTSERHQLLLKRGFQKHIKKQRKREH